MSKVTPNKLELFHYREIGFVGLIFQSPDAGIGPREPLLRGSFRYQCVDRLAEKPSAANVLHFRYPYRCVWRLQIVTFCCIKIRRCPLGKLNGAARARCSECGSARSISGERGAAVNADEELSLARDWAQAAIEETALAAW